MPFMMIRNDITNVEADAVVNPANPELRQGSGTSRAIYLAAGEEKLTAACRRIGYCMMGRAVITEGFDLPAKYIIHTVGPVWRGGNYGEDRLLYKAYMSALMLAAQYELSSIAFPLLSSGSYGYPKGKALRVAVAAFNDFLMEHEMLIYMVLYDRDSFSASQNIMAVVNEYIDDNYVNDNRKKYLYYNRYRQRYEGISRMDRAEYERKRCSLREMSDNHMRKKRLEYDIEHMGETFSQKLLRLIDEKGLTDAQVYHRVALDRRHFSKIRSNPDYKPNKKTVVALAVALELKLDEADDFLRAAGYSLSGNSVFDVIIQFFLEYQIYDFDEINQVLYRYRQPTIGGVQM